MQTDTTLGNRPIPGLEAWLTTATRGLCDEARERIRTEIVAHYLDAFDDAVARDTDPERAQQIAIDSLGDARRVGRAFRRSNLRAWEAGIVASLEKPQSRGALALYLLLILINIGIGLTHIGSLQQAAVLSLSLLLMVAGMLGRFRAARWLARRGRLRAALVADLLGTWLFFATMCIGNDLAIRKAAGTENTVVYGSILVVALLLISHLWPKLNHQGVPTL